MLSYQRLLLSMALVAAASGCASSSTPAADGTDTSPTATEQSAATTATSVASSDIVEAEGLTGLTAELATIREGNGGTLPLADSLDFFASTLGEIPGGDPTRFEHRPGDATMALMSVAAHWSELDAAQQQAVRAVLGDDAPQGFRAATASPAADALQAEIDSARAAIAGFVGSDVPYPIVGEMVPGLTAIYGDDPAPRPVGGLTWPERSGAFASSGQPDRCRVQFNNDSELSASTVAHEVFHCFQYHLATDIEETFTAQRWVIEGSAEWAGAKVGGVDGLADEHFREWAENSGSLYALDYAAIGYYWVLESMGVSPWPVIGAMIAASDIQAVAASGLDPADVLNRVATSLARRQVSPGLDISEVWDFAGGEVPNWGSRTPATVSPERPFQRDIARGSFARGPNGVFTLEGGERVAVSVDSDVGTLEFFEKDPIAWTGGLHQEFCLEEGGCSCGLDGEVESGLEQGSRDLVLAGAELDSGSMNYGVRIPGPTGAFTDGHWEGTITSTVLVVTALSTTGTRHDATAAIEFTIENGAVTAGSYGLSFYVEFVDEGGATGQGTEFVTGVFEGCGFSPQLIGTSFGLDAVLQIPDVGPVPLQFEEPIGGGLPGPGTVWVIDPVTDADQRTGEIDPSADLDFIRSSGYAASDITMTFAISRTG